MSANLLRSPVQLTNSEALRLTQQASQIIQKQSSWPLPYPLSLLSNSDSPEKWHAYENLLFSCLRTGDTRSAQKCLGILKERFGETNERVMGLIGLFHEGIAPDEEALEKILGQYEEVIVERPINMTVRKRRIALLKSMGRPSDAIEALVELLEASPTDAEAWSELAELYFEQGLYSQAVYSLEEVLLITPNAWNVHARLGELLFVSAVASETGDSSNLKGLARSLKEFCRCIELCDDYLRGYYGLKLTATKLQQIYPAGSKVLQLNSAASDEDMPIPSLVKIQKLNEVATGKLAEIIRRYSTKERDWSGYDEAEIIAARELLDRDIQPTKR